MKAQSIILGLAVKCARTMGEGSTAYVSLQAASVDHTLSRAIRKATAAADARCLLLRTHGIARAWRPSSGSSKRAWRRSP